MESCAICNDQASIQDTAQHKWVVTCDFCGLMTTEYDTQYEATQAWDSIHMLIKHRIVYLAEKLSTISDDAIKDFMDHADYNMFLKFIQISRDTQMPWEIFKMNIALQVKIIVLSRESLEKKIREVRGA